MIAVAAQPLEELDAELAELLLEDELEELLDEELELLEDELEELDELLEPPSPAQAGAIKLPS